MRIVYFTDAYWPRINGVTVSVQTFADALKRRSHEVLIVCPEYPKDAGVTPEPEPAPEPAAGCPTWQEWLGSDRAALLALPQVIAKNAAVATAAQDASARTPR